MAPTMTGCQNHLLLIVPATADQQGVDAAAGYVLAVYLLPTPRIAPPASTFSNPIYPAWIGYDGGTSDPSVRARPNRAPI